MLEKAKKQFKLFLETNKKYHYLIDISKSIENLKKHFDLSKNDCVELVKVFEDVFGYLAISNKQNKFWWGQNYYN